MTPTMSAVVFVIGLAYVFVWYGFRRRIRDHHAAIWTELGEPVFIGTTWPQQRRLLRFLAGFRPEATRDWQLVALAWGVRLAIVLFGIVAIITVAAIVRN